MLTINQALYVDSGDTAVMRTKCLTSWRMDIDNKHIYKGENVSSVINALKKKKNVS